MRTTTTTAALALALSFACGAPEDDETARIESWIDDLGTREAEPPSKEITPMADPMESGDYTCSRERWDETKQFDRITAMVANSQSLYPGALVGADALSTGLLVPKVLPRAPLTFSAALEGVLDGEISATVDEPSLSSFRDAMHDILASHVVGQTPANVYAEIEEVSSLEQFEMAIGVGAGWPLGVAQVSTSLEFEKTEVRSRYVIEFVQAYYTVDVDAPGSSAAWFAPEVGLDEIVEEFDDEPPLYVASVTYGRSVVFTVTSELSAEELGAALEFAYRGTASVNGQVSMSHEEVLASSKITAHVLGGSGEGAVQAIFGIEELRAFIEQGGSYTRDSQGAPIAYKLAWAADDSPAAFSLTSEYEVEQCERIHQDVRVGLGKLRVVSDGGDGGDNLELYGDVTVVDGNGGEHVLWSTDADHHVSIQSGHEWPDGGEVGSAIVPVTPQPGEALELRVNLYDDDGNADDRLAETVVARAFEDGWRGGWTLAFAEGDQHVELELELQPVQ